VASRSPTRASGSGAPRSARPTPTGYARRARPGDKWHLDEVFITINGKTYYLWRAVDQHGTLLDILVTLVTPHRDALAATRFFRKLFTGLEYVPRVLVTDKLGSYHAAQGCPLGRAPPVEVSEQPGGELTPTHPPTRTGHDTVHLTRARPVVLLRVQRHLPTRPATPLPAQRRGIPTRHGRPIHRVERGRRPAWSISPAAVAKGAGHCGMSARVAQPIGQCAGVPSGWSPFHPARA
jgi:DDE superfamily endonuclease